MAGFMVTPNLGNYLLLGVFSLIVVSLLTPIMRKISKLFGVFDVPSANHKTHKEPIPYLGGLAIVLGVSTVTYTSLFVFDSSIELLKLASSILIPAALMAGVGLLDDLKNLSPLPRFLTQSLFGISISFLLVLTETLGTPFGTNLLDIPITTFFIVGITNSINFYDNVDGGASGAIAISSVFLFILSWQSSQYLIAALSIVLAGATLGFLIWNKPPARIYMGDSGSMFLGILIASLSVRFDPNPMGRMESLAIPLLLLAMPILDTSVAVASRIKRRISPFQGGRDHLSHRLMRIGLSKRQSVLALWSGSIFFATFTIVISNLNSSIGKFSVIFAGTIWLMLFIAFIGTEDE